MVLKNPGEHVFCPVKNEDIQEPDKGAGDPEDEEEGDLPDVPRDRHQGEYRVEPFKHPEDRVPDDRRKERGDDGIGLKIPDVQYFGGEHSSPERRLEDRPDPRPDPGREREPAFSRRQVEIIRHNRAEPCGDLCRRPFPPGTSPGRDGQDGGDSLEKRDSPADPAVAVECLYRGIGPVSLGLGGKVGDKEPGEQGSCADDRDQEKEAARCRPLGDGCRALPLDRHLVVEEVPHEEPGAPFQALVKQERAEPGDDTNDYRDEKDTFVGINQARELVHGDGHRLLERAGIL